MSDDLDALPTTLGPCGDFALVPTVDVLVVDTDDGPKVEIALTSEPYGWRVRSWWSLPQAEALADRILKASYGANDER